MKDDTDFRNLGETGTSFLQFCEGTPGYKGRELSW